LGCDAADFDFGPAEVDQQAQRLAGDPQIIPALGNMHVAQRRDHLEFDDDLVLDYQVGGIFADDHAVVNDHDSPLPDDAKPRLARLVGKGVLAYPP
jgi:hypothetical protein